LPISVAELEEVRRERQVHFEAYDLVGHAAKVDTVMQAVLHTLSAGRPAEKWRHEPIGARRRGQTRHEHQRSQQNPALQSHEVSL
jgi:hypothetical protein